MTATETVIGTNQFQKIGIPNKSSEIVVTSQSSRILIMASPNTEEAAIHKWYHRTQAGQQVGTVGTHNPVGVIGVDPNLLVFLFTKNSLERARVLWSIVFSNDKCPNPKTTPILTSP